MTKNQNQDADQTIWNKTPTITPTNALWTLLTIALWAALLSFNQKSPESNLLGLIGYAIGYGLNWTFGLSSYLLLALVTSIAIFKVFDNSTSIQYKKYASIGGFILSCSLLITVLGHLFPSFEQAFSWFLGSKALPVGGTPCTYLYKHIPFVPLETLLNSAGTALVAASGIILSTISLCEVRLNLLFKKEESKPIPPKAMAPEKIIPEKQPAPKRTAKFETAPVISMPVIEPPKLKKVIKSDEILPENGQFQLPSFDLLTESKKTDVSQLKEELTEKAALLEATLLNFGIEAKVGQIHCGPTITSFEVHPAIGVKVGKIKTLEHDIALNMKAKSIRIIAPIPGKAAVGIEIPNLKPQEVAFKEVLSAYVGEGSKLKIPMILGKSVSGELVVCDLSKLPHCIIAGATGSGKSVCINSIIMSILMLKRPDEVRLLMIDPKKVELTPYSKLPHMIAPVITEPEAAANALNWLVKEMEKRYEILKITGVRNIDSFNKRTPGPDELHSIIQIPEKMPYYVAIIDELADLMMVASSDIETPIARIAQMARAVGIHLILATQRPSRDVITGLIKANFPARIAFKVASRVNSQIILDDTGAETLLGYGDMLFLLPGSSQLIRAQGVLVRDDEINDVIESIQRQAGPQYLIQSFEKIRMMESSDLEEDRDVDSLYEEAKSIVFATGNASTTFLQRRLKIGYPRAASIMDQLEEQGIIGPQDGSKPRTIYFPQKAAADVLPNAPLDVLDLEEEFAEENEL